MKPNIDSKNCILVEDSVQQQQHNNHQSSTSSASPTEESIQQQTSTLDVTAGMPSLPSQPLQQQQQHQPNQPFQQQLQYSNGHHGQQDESYSAAQQLKWPQVIEIKDFNILYHANIPPYQFWNLELLNKHPTFIRFSFTMPWGGNFAIYGRRNVAASVTQYDFVEFVKGGRIDNRVKRRRRDTDNNNDDDVNVDDDGDDDYDDHVEEDVRTPLDSGKVIVQRLNRTHQILKRSATSSGPITLDNNMETAIVNVTVLQYLDSGKWVISIYNDDLVAHTVTAVSEEAEGVTTTCPSDCNGRGSCYLGKCDCIDGYQGVDCSKSKYLFFNNNKSMDDAMANK